MGSDQSTLPSSLSPFITQTRLEREGHLEWGEGSCNERRVLDLSEVGGMISVMEKNKAGTEDRGCMGNGEGIHAILNRVVRKNPCRKAIFKS